MTMADPKIAYNELPNLPSQLFNFDDPEILKKSLEVAQQMSALNAVLRLDVSSIKHGLDMLSPLYVPEAVMSSGVENIVTTNESVYEARVLDEGEISPQDKEVMRYVEALSEGFELLTKSGYLATNHYISMQKTLEPNKTGIRKLPGTTLSNRATKEVYYTPPDNEKTIRDLLKNLEDYFNEASPPHEVFARAAIIHYQFEAIHPFHDGNGRTGRVLIPLYLTLHKAIDVPLLFVSRYILSHHAEYYERLRAVTYKNEWKEWVMYMLDAFSSQASYTLDVLERIRSFRVKLEKRLDKTMGRTYARDIATFLYTHPFFIQSEFEGGLDVSYVTSRKYLQSLIDAKIVVRRKQPGRNRYIYACPEYITLLKKA